MFIYTSISVIVLNSFSMAISRGVFPYWSFTSLFTPFSNSFLVILTLPPREERWRGVI